MFSDTHFHFYNMTQERGLDGTEVLAALAGRDTFFGLDIGTKADDLFLRKQAIDRAASLLCGELKKKAEKLIHYSAGIWPDVESIKNRYECLETLKKNILMFNEAGEQEDGETGKQEEGENAFNAGKKSEGRGDCRKILAIGECGLDHHWNPSGADGRCQEDFDEKIFKGEKELFMMQIELAEKTGLPLIVHSRDAFEDTLGCLDELDFHNGIIHCYSYGLSEAKEFLDRGWYLAFGGGTTYTKKAKMPQMAELLRYVPEDRILLETDAPYLAPVPFRGQTNSPVLVEHCYSFVASARNTTPQNLSETVDKNIKKLFGL
ncbi:MAG: TatD family hydrolase [Spirochaetia bacterium]|nr:TatD family hydrolase [Spirochaetia bacterium]